MKKILVVAPHMDDETLGCGSVIAKHKEAGDKVAVVFVAHRAYNHKFDEKLNEVERGHALKAKEVLGYDDVSFLDLPDERLDTTLADIIVPLESCILEVDPDTVYIPFKGDNNQDHRAVFDAMRVVLRPAATPRVSTIYMYEVPSSTEQSPPIAEAVFMPNHHVDVKAHIEKKLEAFRCYGTESRAYPHPRSEEAMRVLAQKRGIEAGLEFAEAFMTLRSRWS